MEIFTKLYESFDIENQLSNEFKELKLNFLKLIDYKDINDLKFILNSNIDGFANKIAISIDKLNTSDEIYSFYLDNTNQIDILLASKEWFNDSPKSKGITSTKIYNIESTKFALSDISKQILKNIS